MAESPIPTDDFSRLMRSARDNPGALIAGSTIHMQDFYGNAETWVIETARVDSEDYVFLQHQSIQGAHRFVLTPIVTRALARHGNQLAARVRRRGARQAVALRKQRGDKLGNPAALAAARAARKKATK
jgi:hypothetical protein